jgi:hypothetical protein
VEIADLIIDLSNLQYGRINEWCLGAVNDEEFLGKTLSGILLLMIGATSGKASTNASEAYAQLHSDSGFRRQLVSKARERITAMEFEASRTKVQKKRQD